MGHYGLSFTSAFTRPSVWGGSAGLVDDIYHGRGIENALTVSCLRCWFYKGSACKSSANLDGIQCQPPRCTYYSCRVSPSLSPVLQRERLQVKRKLGRHRSDKNPAVAGVELLTFRVSISLPVCTVVSASLAAVASVWDGRRCRRATRRERPLEQLR